MIEVDEDVDLGGLDCQVGEGRSWPSSKRVLTREKKSNQQRAQQIARGSKNIFLPGSRTPPSRDHFDRSLMRGAHPSR